MSLFDGHYLVNENRSFLDFVKCGESASDMKTVNFYARPEVKEFLISSFSREGILFQRFQVRFNNPSAFLIERMNESGRIDIDANLEHHFPISESGTNLPRFLIRSVSSINLVSESLRMSSLMTSS